MKLKKTVAVIVIMAIAIMTAQMSVFALSDVDFTLDIDSSITQYISGDEVKVPIKIKTQTEHGYVDMQLKLTFDKDALSLNTILTAENDRGFTTELVDDGVIIYYKSPDGRVSPIDTYVLNLSFSVITGAGGGNYKFELKVDRCMGLDENGSQEEITVSDAKAKTITIVETTGGENDGTSDAGVYTGNTGASIPGAQISGNNAGLGGTSSDTGCSAGEVIAIIFGAIVMFAGGVVVGYILCQRRESQNLDDSDDYDDREDTGFSGRFSRAGNIGRRPLSTNNYDDDDNNDIYADLATRGGARAVSLMDEDDEVDTSYFGRATDSSPSFGEKSAGLSMDDDDDDDGFPDEFKPLGYDDDDDDEFGSYGVLGNRRRGRDDDGYGSFGGDDDDDDDYRNDRRRYR